MGASKGIYARQEMLFDIILMSVVVVQWLTLYIKPPI